MATAAAASAAPAHPKPKVAATKLTIKNKPIAHNHHHADMITGVLTSHRKAVAGETVWLESRRTTGKKFAVVGSATTGADGSASFAVTPSKKTQYELVFKGDATHRKSHSGVITLKAV